VDLLGLGAGGRLAGADGPDGLVGENGRLHLIGRQTGEAAADLGLNDLLGDVSLAFGEGFTHADDGDQVVRVGVGGLLGDQSVGFLLELTTLAVSEDHIAHRQLTEHARGDLTGEGAVARVTEVLSTQTDVRTQNELGNVGKGRECGANHHIHFLHRGQLANQAGNWKSNKTNSEAVALVTDLIRELAAVKEVDVVVCPAFTALSDVSKLILGSNIRLGAQNLSDSGYGAFTGEIAPGMLRELSVRYVILGHSERRQFQKESDALVAKKAANAHANNLIPIVCVGETLAEREANITEKVVETQVRGSLAGLTADQVESTVLAYEPVWAIGTGKTATSAQAQEVHAFIRKVLVSMHGEAPPTSAPSMSGCWSNSRALEPFTLPPYWMRTRQCEGLQCP